MCLSISDILFVDIGEQNTSDYSYDETSTSCALTLKGKPEVEGNERWAFEQQKKKIFCATIILFEPSAVVNYFSIIIIKK